MATKQIGTKQALKQKRDAKDQVLWMADCYSLAKKFPNPHTWLALLEPVESSDAEKLNPFHYWLWMEIWKAAQLAEKDEDIENEKAYKGYKDTRYKDTSLAAKQ
jgi:hypothetical protein